MATHDTLVLGITGSFGGAVGRELVVRGRRVRALVRAPERARKHLGPVAPHVELIEGNAEDPADVARAAEGAAALVHSVNYPYDRWVPHMEHVTRNVVRAAEHAGAMVVFPGNVYALRPDFDRPLDELQPSEPISKKGWLRARLESQLRHLAESTATRVLIVRANDYFGPTVRNGLVDPIFGAAARGKRMMTIGNPDIPHEMVYVPDLARATVDVMDLPDRPPFELVHVAGYVEPTHRALLERVARIAGSKPRITRIPRWMLRALGLYDGTVRELQELMYLFEHTLLLSDAKLRRLLPHFQYTPIDDAIATTLQSYRKGPGLPAPPPGAEPHTPRAPVQIGA
jgi:nucleoside-diphosphate-sugar epimerase